MKSNNLMQEKPTQMKRFSIRSMKNRFARIIENSAFKCIISNRLQLYEYIKSKYF